MIKYKDTFFSFFSLLLHKKKGERLIFYLFSLLVAQIKKLRVIFFYLFNGKLKFSLLVFLFQCLPNLRRLDLSHSKNLIEVPDLSDVPLLTDLILEGCTEIIQIDQSIGFLRELQYLNLKNCKKLFLNLNVIFGLSSLRRLILSGCSKLLNSKMLMDQRYTEHLENVDKNTNVIQLPLYKLLMFPFHFFSPPKPEDSLGLLLSSLSCIPCLLDLDISFCNLHQIPDEIGNLRSLKYLNLGGNEFVTLPSTIKELSNLQRLNLEHCKQLKYLPELPTIKEKTKVGYYGELYIFDCPKLSEMEKCYSMVFSWMMQNLEVTTILSFVSHFCFVRYLSITEFGDFRFTCNLLFPQLR